MQFFNTYFLLSLKRRLRNVSYLVTSLFFLVLMTFIAWVIPLDDEPSAIIGISYPDTQVSAQKIVSLLHENSSFQLIFYSLEEVDQMKRDILAGTLIKGYVLDAEIDTRLATGDTEGLVKTYVSEGSSATLIADEMVAAAILEISAPYTATNYVLERFEDGVEASDDMTDYIENLLSDGPLIAMDIDGGHSELSIQSLKEITLFPVLYSILITLFILSAIMGCLMESKSQTVGAQIMLARTNRPISVYGAPLLACLLTDFVVLIACDMMIGVFLPVNPYAPITRLLVVVILAVFTTLLLLLLRRLRRWHTVITVFIPILVMQNLFFSGAILNPVMLGTPLSLLRFFSPGWYLLQLLESFGS